MIPIADMNEVGERARDLVPRREDRIEDGRLNGRHWFVAVVNEARQRHRRNKAWSRRKSRT